MEKYKRLTIKDEKTVGLRGGLVNQKQDAFDVCADAFNVAVNRLAELEDKIENGTLVELPCKVGDTVYFVNDYRPAPIIEEYVVYGIMLDGSEITLHIDFMKTINAKNVYFTKAEAEQRLKELQNER